MGRNFITKGLVHDLKSSVRYPFSVSSYDDGNKQGVNHLIRISNNGMKVGFVSFFLNESSHFGGMKINQAYRTKGFGNLGLELYHSINDELGEKIGETGIQRKPTLCYVLGEHGYVPTVGKNSFNVGILKTNHRDKSRIFIESQNFKEKFLNSNIFKEGNYELLEHYSEKYLWVKVGPKYELKDFEKLEAKRKKTLSRFEIKLL